MLLPASASNPANMMAQALAIYKNLIGNESGGRLPGKSQSGSTDHTEIEASSSEYGGDSSSKAELDDQHHIGEPVFSLQSQKDKK